MLPTEEAFSLISLLSLFSQITCLPALRDTCMHGGLSEAPGPWPVSCPDAELWEECRLNAVSEHISQEATAPGVSFWAFPPSSLPLPPLFLSLCVYFLLSGACGNGRVCPPVFSREKGGGGVCVIFLRRRFLFRLSVWLVCHPSHCPLPPGGALDACMTHGDPLP